MAWGTPWGFIQQGARANVRACAFVRVGDLRGREFLGIQNWFAVVSLLLLLADGAVGNEYRGTCLILRVRSTALLRG